MSDLTPTTTTDAAPADEAPAQPATPAPAGALDLDEQTATDVENLRTLTAEIADRKAQADTIKARLREHWRAGERYTFGGRAVLSIGAAVPQFDADLAARVIPAALVPSVSVSRLDADLCKRILPADLYAKCCKPKSPAVKPL